MSNTAKLKKKATELEQKKQFDKALQLYIQLLEEAGRELDDADLHLYNRVGDLLMRQGNASEALSYYEKAVDVYAERGFLNNAIALCSKILRQSPARTSVYYKLGKISANKGFKSDAKKNFLEYADRMEKTGQRHEAFRALKEFADLCPDQDDIRLMLAELLSKDNRKDEAIEQLQTLYDKLEGEGRGAEARATIDRMKSIDPAVAPRAAGTQRVQKSNELVFLDLTDDVAGSFPAVDAIANASAPDETRRSTLSDIPALEGLTFTFIPDDPAIDVSTSRDDAADVQALMSTGDGFDPLDIDAMEALLKIPDESLATIEHDAEATRAAAVLPLADLKPTAAAPIPDDDLLLDPPTEPAGWEPTVAQARHAFTTPMLAPLIDEPVLTGSEFAELSLKDAMSARTTPVHDLLLPTALPLLVASPDASTEGMAPVGTDAYGMESVDSPSPIDLTDLVDDPAVSIDLMAELTSPFSRENARKADELELTAAGIVEPLGVEVPASQFVLAEGFAASLGDDAAAVLDASIAPPESHDSPRGGTPREAEPSELTAISVDDAFADAHVSLSPAVTDSVEALPAVEGPDSLPGEKGTDEPGEQGLLASFAGFGDLDPDAASFTPSPRLSAATLQPEGWNGDESPEVLIDGEWHDEHVGEAAHVTPSRSRAGIERFDDLAAAMMWVPSDDADGTTGQHEATADDAVMSPFGTPRGHVSFGGVEEQLRRRLELVPENWGLRRQLGEVLLDAGDREAGLYELDLAMAGYELSGDLLGARDVADEIVRLVPSSVRHHQKRVEYSVRTGDRLRLADAYMELGDALFRQGEPAKAQAVYSRVLELNPRHERAIFAAAAAAQIEPPNDPRLESMTVDDAFAEWEPPTHVLASFVSASSGDHSATSSDANDEDTPVGAVESSTGHGGQDRQDDLPETERSPDEGTTPDAPAESSASERPMATLGSAADRSKESGAASGGETSATGSQDAAHSDSASALNTESLRDAVMGPRCSNEVSAIEDAHQAFPRAPESPTLSLARSMTPVGSKDDEYVDLGEWLRMTEPERTTRMVVGDAKPSGDEQADFDEMLRRFKQGVAANVEDEDFASQYDLGVAYKEMGLVDEAISQFQRSLRGESHRIKSYEALGQCFVEKGQYAVATALLQRAAESRQVDDHRLVGVLYLLGYSMEEMGRRAEAMRYYQRVFAVDIEFRDVAQRVAAMEHQTT